MRKVYRICDGRPDAIKPTHGVVTATLVVDPDTGKLAFPTPSNRSTKTKEPCPTLTSCSTSPESTTTTTQTTTKSTLTLPTTLVTAPARPSTKSSETLPSSTEDPSAVETETSAPAPLSKGQVAGISLGAICAAAGVVLGIVFLSRYCLRRRRRRNGKKRPYISHMDTWGYQIDKRSNSVESSFTDRHLNRHTGPYPPHILPGQGYSRTSWRPSAIGLAISPSKQRDQANTPTRTLTRPMSRLLPAKPDLPPVPRKNTPPLPPVVVRQATMSPQLEPPHPPATYTMQAVAAAPPSNKERPQPPRLVIPEASTLHQTSPAELPAQNINTLRESGLTEFEEEGHRSTSPAGTIWHPPSANPASAAAAYYVADKHGNWALANPRQPPDDAKDTIMTPLSAEPKIETAQSILFAPAVTKQVTSKPPAPAPNLPPEPKTPALQQTTAPPKTPKTMPSPLFSRQPNPRSCSQPLPSNTASNPTAVPNRPGRSRATSADSGITTISTSSEASDDYVPQAPVYNLSPVAESPQSRTANNAGAEGHSPVAYPRIPGRGGGTPAIRGRPFSRGGRNMIPPPRRPMVSHNTPSQASPTPGTNRPPYPPDDPRNQPTMRIVSPSPAPEPQQPPPQDDRAILPSAARRRQRPPSHLPHPFPMHPRPRPTNSYRGRGGRYTQPQQRHQQQQPAYHPMPIPQPYQTRPDSDEHQVHQHWRPPRPTQPPQGRADSPSLLAKRLGTERAANMAMPRIQPSSTHGQWRQTPPQGGEARAAWVPPAYPVTPDLPSTPTWLPRLTPTRRGDDLFLNVG